MYRRKCIMARKPVKHIMLDLETLAIAPNAAVIQAGLAYLDSESNMVKVSEYSCSPMAYRELSSKFEMTQDTVNFHKKVNPENYTKCIESDLTVGELAVKIRDEIKYAKFGESHAIWLWCCGTDFDIPILNNLLSQCNVKPVWAYGNVRDYRTLRELYKNEIPLGKKGDHSAGKDAAVQYMHLHRILERLGKWETVE
jgi:hypothetical protein